MNLKYITAMAAIALLAIGCGDNKTAETEPAATPAATTKPDATAPAAGGNVVGNWTVKEMPGFDVEFRADGTMTANLMQVPNLPGGKILTESTYKVEGDKMTTVGTSGTVEGVDADKKKLMEDSMKAELGKELKGTIKWINDNEFTVTADVGGAVVTYVRK